MLGFSKFWEALSEGVAQRWAERVLSPALLFWTIGVAAYSSRHGTTDLTSFIDSLDNVEKVLWLVGALALVGASAALMEGFEAGAQRMLEGYWPAWLDPVSGTRVAVWATRFRTLRRRWLSLAQNCSSLSDIERAEYRRLDRDLALYPEDPARIMPTRLGNVMTAAETHSTQRYGLAAALMWPRLWLILPDEVRSELIGARRQFNSAVQAVVWAVATSIWVIWSWVALPFALIAGYWSYRRAIATGTAFGQLLSAAFDIHIRELAAAYGLKLVEGELFHRDVGRLLTLFVRRGNRPF